MKHKTMLPQLSYTPSKAIYKGDRVFGQTRAYWELTLQISDDLSIAIQVTHDYADALQEQVSFWFIQDGTYIRSLSDVEFQERLRDIEQHESLEAAQQWEQSQTDVASDKIASILGFPPRTRPVWTMLVNRWTALLFVVNPSVCH